MENVIIFGGDGFCGWPTALKLSRVGYNVMIVDNLARRKIDVELGCRSLTPIAPIDIRQHAWYKVSGEVINFKNIDVSENYHRILTIFEDFEPSAIVHFAEQRAAPYSMKSPMHKKYTVNNNINATHNILCAIVESGLDIHMVHLGTTGYYGYSNVNMDIPEGYLVVRVTNRDGVDEEIEIMYPPNPGSIYHMTKVQDAVMFSYFNKNDGVRITDLHQGIVWGTQTRETKMHPDLINRFDYDGDFGTVLNRFLMQAAIGHPLTVYGTGGQTRAFINITNTADCVKLAIESPPKSGEKVRVLNQTTECLNVGELAKKVSDLMGAEIRYYSNPRQEAEKNDLMFVTDGLMGLGLNPITLDDGLLEEIVEVAKKYVNRCILDRVICTSLWNRSKLIDYVGSEKPIGG